MQEPHYTGTMPPRDLNDGSVATYKHKLDSMRAQPLPYVPSQSMNQYNHGNTVNPQMLSRPQSGGPLINHGHPSPLPINSNQYQAHDTSYNIGQQQSSLPTDYVNNVGYISNPQMLARPQFEGPLINHGHPSPLPINSNQYQAHDTSYNLGQQPTQIQGDGTSDMGYSDDQEAPLFSWSNFMNQLSSMPIFDTDDNGHDISQPAPAYFPAEGTPTYRGQQPQMTINQTNFNGVNNYQQAYPAMTTTAVSSFARLSPEVQAAEFQHFVQQRRALGDTQPMEFKTFKEWYIGRQLNGSITPTLEYGVHPLHNHFVFGNNAPIQQPITPQNNQGYMHMPTMIFQNTGAELNTGFQHTMGPSATLNVQAMQTNNERYLQQPQTSINSDIRARRTSLAIASASQSLLPVSLPSMAFSVPPSIARGQAPPPTEKVPAPPLIARAQAPSSTKTMTAPPSIARAQAPQSTKTIPASGAGPAGQPGSAGASHPGAVQPGAVQPPSTKTMTAPPSITAAPVVTRRTRKLQNEDPEEMGNKTCATGKKTSREQKTEATPATQEASIPTDQDRFPDENYKLDFLDMEQVYVSPEDADDLSTYRFFEKEIDFLDVEKREGQDELYMRRNQQSLNIMQMALRRILQHAMALLLQDTSPDARKSLENYVATNTTGTMINPLKFATKSQWVEEIGVVHRTEKPVQMVKYDFSEAAMHKLWGKTVEFGLNGTEIKGSYWLYTKTICLDAITPLKYAIVLETQVAKVGNRRARGGALKYERSLPSNIAGEPRWADILDLFKLQAEELGVRTTIQHPPTNQTSTSASLSNQQQSDTKEQWSTSGPVQGQKAQTGKPITPEPQKVCGEKRKRQQESELHPSPVSFASSSETFNSSSDNGNSPTSNASTDRTSASPQSVSVSPRLSDNSRSIKRSRNGNEVGSRKEGTSMKKSSPLRWQASLPSSTQPIMDGISRDDHMHPSRSPYEIVRPPFTTEPQNCGPTQVSAQAHELSLEEQIAEYEQGKLRANSDRPYEYYPDSGLTQSSRTSSTQSDMLTQVQGRPSRKPTEAELAHYRRKVLDILKRPLPDGKKSS
ncbi:hypothetical protein EAE96_004073 [Botrytis aclada]|nr:hypothetical protein EAE96_004073 [Botrytis aclada]